MCSLGSSFVRVEFRIVGVGTEVFPPRAEVAHYTTRNHCHPTEPHRSVRKDGNLCDFCFLFVRSALWTARRLEISSARIDSAANLTPGMEGRLEMRRNACKQCITFCSPWRTAVVLRTQRRDKRLPNKSSTSLFLLVARVMWHYLTGHTVQRNKSSKRGDRISVRAEAISRSSFVCSSSAPSATGRISSGVQKVSIGYN